MFCFLPQEINRLNEENTKLRDRIKVLEGKVRQSKTKLNLIHKLCALCHEHDQGESLHCLLCTMWILSNSMY